MPPNRRWLVTVSQYKQHSLRYVHCSLFHLRRPSKTRVISIYRVPCLHFKTGLNSNSISTPMRNRKKVVSKGDHRKFKSIGPVEWSCALADQSRFGNIKGWWLVPLEIRRPSLDHNGREGVLNFIKFELIHSVIRFRKREQVLYFRQRELWNLVKGSRSLPSVEELRSNVVREPSFCGWCT